VHVEPASVVSEDFFEDGAEELLGVQVDADLFLLRRDGRLDVDVREEAVC